MIRVKKENHRSWFMSNYYPCEFVMNGIKIKRDKNLAHLCESDIIALIR